MTKGIFIVGTDTDVGKTVVAAGIMHVLRSNGYNAAYFKAALSGASEEDGKLIPGDAKLVREVSDLNEEYKNITPYIYKTPVSPHLAAKLENNHLNLDIVKKKYAYLKGKYDFIIAEGSGGIICPLIDDERGVYTIENLIKDLSMDVIIVSRAGLGTINHTVLTVKYLQNAGITIRGIIINNYKESLLHDDNIKMIEKLTGINVIGKLKSMENRDNNIIEDLRRNAEKALKIEKIIECMGNL